MGTPLPDGNSIVTINLTYDSYVHLMHVLDGMIVGSGAIQGRPANVSVNPKVRLLVDALYEVLSGGTVADLGGGTLRITAGDSGHVGHLKTMETACVNSTKAINGPTNTEVVVPV